MRPSSGPWAAPGTHIASGLAPQAVTHSLQDLPGRWGPTSPKVSASTAPSDVTSVAAARVSTRDRRPSLGTLGNEIPLAMMGRAAEDAGLPGAGVNRSREVGPNDRDGIPPGYGLGRHPCGEPRDWRCS